VARTTAARWVLVVTVPSVGMMEAELLPLVCSDRCVGGPDVQEPSVGEPSMGEPSYSR
jgi:hypothetical protein